MAALRCSDIFYLELYNNQSMKSHALKYFYFLMVELVGIFWLFLGTPCLHQVTEVKVLAFLLNNRSIHTPFLKKKIKQLFQVCCFCFNIRKLILRSCLVKQSRAESENTDFYSNPDLNTKNLTRFWILFFISNFEIWLCFRFFNLFCYSSHKNVFNKNIFLKYIKIWFSFATGQTTESESYNNRWIRSVPRFFIDSVL